jgi:cytochrome c oxidase subunit 4
MPQPIVAKKIYALVAVALLALTLITVEVAFVDLGRLNALIALTIAVVKALLVILYFMHVRYSSPLTWVYVGAGVVWLIILLSLTMGDFLTRHWLSIPG